MVYKRVAFSGLFPILTTLVISLPTFCSQTRRSYRSTFCPRPHSIPFQIDISHKQTKLLLLFDPNAQGRDSKAGVIQFANPFTT